MQELPQLLQDRLQAADTSPPPLTACIPRLGARDAAPGMADSQAGGGALLNIIPPSQPGSDITIVNTEQAASTSIDHPTVGEEEVTTVC